MGSSMVYLGLSIIVFLLSFGMLFAIAPVILGGVSASLEQAMLRIGDNDPDNPWVRTFYETSDISTYLVPLMMAGGLTILVVKVLMTATARGRD